MHNPRTVFFHAFFIRFINGNDSHKRLERLHVTFPGLQSTSDFPTLPQSPLSLSPQNRPGYRISVSHIFVRFVLQRKATKPPWGELLPHLYIALRGRVPRCRRVFVGASPRCQQGWHHTGRPMGPYVDVAVTGVEHLRLEPCKHWLVSKAFQTVTFHELSD